MKTRECFKCFRSITGCFGFVHAGDFIEAMEGRNSRVSVREVCGSCVLFASRDEIARNLKEDHLPIPSSAPA